MSIQLDPEDSETTALLDYTDFTNKRVLEIGCGDGRLTWRYADHAAQVIAIDPEADRIEAAIKDMPEHLKDRVEFLVSGIQDYSLSTIAPLGVPADRSRRGRREEPNRNQTPQELFDVVFMSWSLC